MEELDEEAAGVPVVERRAPAPKPHSPAPAATGSSVAPQEPTEATHPDDACLACGKHAEAPRRCPACRSVIVCSDACFAHVRDEHATVCPLMRKFDDAPASLSEIERRKLGVAQSQLVAPAFIDDEVSTGASLGWEYGDPGYLWRRWWGLRPSWLWRRRGIVPPPMVRPLA